ncbi:pectate lyase [bacterium]
MKKYSCFDNNGFWVPFSFFIGLFLMVCTNTTMAQQLAFPQAEGFGRFTTGGRGGKVLEITNLNDGGSGSLRAAIDEIGPRTIVFRVSGTIALDTLLIIQNGDLTIAGQTAPGDGICIKNYPVIIQANNIIIRYLRSRLGDEKKQEGDAISAVSHNDIMIDHCSFSWGNDEVATFRDNINTTVQWCIISESLHNSCHHKGPHGYGGIWGGKGATFHHNLIAHNASRNPRMNGSRYHKKPKEEVVDFRNNVIYNWGFNSIYGGEAGNQNVVANYFKAGPGTKKDSLKFRIAEPWDDQGKWYIAKNFVYGYPGISKDNWSGGVQAEPDALKKIRVNKPHEVVEIATQSTEEAFEMVLNFVGAILPRRDTVDTRIVNEVRSGKATFGGLWGNGSGIIDSQAQVGGWPELNTYHVPIDNDHDGIPDKWELEKGLDPDNPEDCRNDMNQNGYTNLEDYLNSLTISDHASSK